MNKAECIRHAHDLNAQGQHDQAVQLLRAYLGLYPDDPDLNQHLGLLLLPRPDSLPEAVTLLEKSVRLAPHVPAYRTNWATALSLSGQHERAASEYRRALAMHPLNFAAHHGLSSVLLALGEYDQAIASARQAAALEPVRVETWLNLAAALVRAGRWADVPGTFEEALRHAPDHPVLLANLAACVHAHDRYDAARIREIHRRLGRVLAGLAPASQPPDTVPDPDRPLRIGYLSPHFRGHALEGFLRPLLERHDRQQYPACCYAQAPANDQASQWFASAAVLWRDVSNLNDDAVASQIRADAVDILVDLAGHAPGSRAALLSRRVAPVQVSYLGYPTATHLACEDWHLADAVIAPLAESPAGAWGHDADRDRTRRLDGCWCCWSPPGDAPPVTPRDSAADLSLGYTAGVARISESLARAWSRILDALPQARVVIVASGLEHDHARNGICRALARWGIPSPRLQFRSPGTERAERLATLSDMDLLLGAFPDGSPASVCEALWMGVPVIAWRGGTDASRLDAGVLTGAGLPDLIAGSADQYVETVVALARDVARRRALRHTLRPHLACSPLCDQDAFIARLQHAYRQMWRDYCRRVTT